jgi:bacteriophage exclusion system BrxA-like protein
MTASSRAHVASSFTGVKGAMINETYAVFAAWDFARSKRENLDRLREENFIGASSATWLRDVAKVLNRRFEPEGRDRALVELAKNGCALEEWKPLLLWHMTRDEFLVRDFLQNWLFPAYDAGAFRVRPEELHTYLQRIGKRGATTEHAWTEQTTNRVAAGAPKPKSPSPASCSCASSLCCATRSTMTSSVGGAGRPRPRPKEVAA